jgi:hypothetical protein
MHKQDTVDIVIYISDYRWGLDWWIDLLNTHKL